MGDTESRGSRVCNSWWNQSGRKQKQKDEVYGEVLSRLKGLNVKEASVPGFDDELWAHFYYLPTRYALDMNVERAQDVLMHKRLLHMARFPTIATGPAIEVRLVQVRASSAVRSPQYFDTSATMMSFHPPPAFASSANLELDLCKSQLQAEDKSNNFNFYAHYARNSCRPVHEITISTNDKPKLLSQLTSLISETGLDIQEAHAFSTLDGYSLDVFVVGGWAVEETEKLKHVLAKKMQKLEKQPQLKENGTINTAEQGKRIWRFWSFRETIKLIQLQQSP